ncbi:MAG TPA: VPLPA-CTERM sorting domain-containing protein [Gammaproteobacteria bacterium]
MKKTNLLHAASIAGLLALPIGINAQTITPDALGDDSMDTPSLEEISNMTIADLVKLNIDGEPLTVYVHLGEGEDKNIIIYSASYPDGMWKPDDGGGETPAVPLPGAVWLLGSGMVGLAAIARRRYNGNNGGGDAAVQPAGA